MKYPADVKSCSARIVKFSAYAESEKKQPLSGRQRLFLFCERRAIRCVNRGKNEEKVRTDYNPSSSAFFCMKAALSDGSPF